MKFCRIWMKHAVFNFVSAGKNIFHGFAPPQWTRHDDEQLEYIDARSIWKNAREGWTRW